MGDFCVFYFSKNLTLQCLQVFGVRKVGPFVGYYFYTKNQEPWRNRLI